ncbi:hypothetical protein AGLY_006617 [Aphis glycines]|uniref:SLC26A/SulP transporter domain-containing protein n=1 Tax=Aphis glycines TaxID=307491 RepID=A0A6G0TRN6_APHGL|nr:hypothetical protein AGLY_006617 [Aphis glycines]
MLALGACNLISSFVGSMPISGALSRGAVNNASGVKTTFGGVYTGIIVIIALQFFTPYLVYIPKAALAAVIIAAVVFMVELQVVKPMWRTKKIDLIPAFATFLCSLLIRLEVGIVVGIAINVIILLYTLARPSIHVEKQKVSKLSKHDTLIMSLYLHSRLTCLNFLKLLNYFIYVLKYLNFYAIKE